MSMLGRLKGPVIATMLGAGLLVSGPGPTAASPRVGAPVAATELSPTTDQPVMTDPPTHIADVRISEQGLLPDALHPDLAQILSRLAHISEADTNPLDLDLSSAQQQGLFRQLSAALLAPKQSEAPGTRDQVLQASAAVLLLDLARITKDSALKTEIISAYAHGVENASGINRRFMILDLDRVASELGPQALKLAHEHIAEVAPTSPPYASWFADGNDTVRVDYHVGSGFWSEETDGHVDNGWQRTDNDDGTRTLKKSITFEPLDGDPVTTHFEVTLHNGSRGLFAKMEDPNVHMVVYSGHASYGRHVPQQLARGTDLVGDKVFMGLQCGGKGTQDPVADRYPTLAQIQTKNSSYGFQDRETFRAVIDGIARRDDWAGTLKGRSFNYYGPSDRQTTERALDRDQDGRVDALDRVASHGLEQPQAVKVKDQLKPVATATAAKDLDGAALHAVGLRLHRMLGYTDYADHLQNQAVLNDGFFDGSLQDPLLRIDERADADGNKQYRIRVNKTYAGASEEVLGAALHFELGRHFSASEADYEPDAAIAAGLLMAAKALKVDNDSHDTQAFDALTGYAGIESVSLRDARRALSVDDDSAGNPAQVKALLDELAARGVKLR